MLPSDYPEKSTIIVPAIPAPARRIAVEANLLRLPLFALQTKGLRSLDGFECRGQTNRNGETREFLFRTARSTATLYPGPLSRSAHLAFLSLLTEQGLPTSNPITWTWRDLCRRMGTSPSGREVQQLKTAIEATAGLTISSRDAVYSKPDSQSLTTRKTTHLYESVVFVNEPLLEGGVADKNYLWLSPWYLDNLNALFTAPLDHELWRFLDKQSPIASRLYEFLLINFFNGMPQFRINYRKLAQFLPVRPERYLSDAHRQFDEAFAWLQQSGVATGIHWHDSKTFGEVAQIHFDRGPRLDRSPRGTNSELESSSTESTELLAVTEIRRPPEQQLVNEFYRLWTGEIPLRASPKEIELSQNLIRRYGRSRLQGLLPLVVEQLKQHWPGAKTFLAVEKYVAAAATDFDQLKQRLQQREQLHRHWRKDEQEQARKAAEREQFEAKWLAVWNQLTSQDRESIRHRVLADLPMFRSTPRLLQTKCLDELAKRSAKIDPADLERGAA